MNLFKSAALRVTLSSVTVAFLVGAMALTGTGCSKAGIGGGSSEVVVTVDGTKVTKDEYDRVASDLKKSFNVDTVSDPKQKDMIETTIKQMVLNKLIVNALVKNAADQEGIKVTDEEVAKFKEDQIFKNPQAKEEFKKFLAQQMMSEEEFDKVIREQLLIDEFIKHKAGKAIEVSDKEVSDFYKENAQQFSVPESINAKHILVQAGKQQLEAELKKADPKLEGEALNKAVAAKKEEKKAEAQKLLAEVKADPKKFGELAKAHSEDPGSANRGGELGDMVERSIVPEFWAVLKSTPDHAIHPSLVETQFGYHIVEVNAHKPPHKVPVDQAKADIENFLSQQKKQKVMQDWFTQQREKAKIEIAPKYEVKEPQMPMQQAGGQPQPESAPAPSKH